MKKKLKEDTDLKVATFVYNNIIPFNVLKGEELIKTCEMIVQFGIGYSHHLTMTLQINI